MPDVIKVRFANGDLHMPVNASTADRELHYKEYSYFYVGADQKVSPDSYAVVEVSGRLKIVKVVGKTAVKGKATKYAITTFTLSDHKELIKTTEEIAELEYAAQQQVSDSKKMAEMRNYAKDDPTLAAILEKLEAAKNKLAGAA